MSKDNRGSSAHANGGAAEVKKALFFGGSTPFLWASTKEMGSKGRTSQKPPPNVSAHTHKPKEKANPLFAPFTCAPFYWAIDRAGPARSTPFLCSCAKKRGGAPKKRAFGCRHGSCSVPPASPTNSKPQHHSRLRQADLSARSTASPLPKSGEERIDYRLVALTRMVEPPG